MSKEKKERSVVNNLQSATISSKALARLKASPNLGMMIQILNLNHVKFRSLCRNQRVAFERITDESVIHHNKFQTKRYIFKYN